jgi:hypothetical protein
MTLGNMRQLGVPRLNGTTVISAFYDLSPQQCLMGINC